MESIAGESSTNGNVQRDDDYRKRILQSAYNEQIVFAPENRNELTRV